MQIDTTPQLTFDIEMPIQERANALSKVSEWLGCGVYRFEKTGRTQIESLVRNGLSPWHKFLDIGCGAMCGGYWVMRFLNQGNFHGIEPNVPMWQAGVNYIVEPGLIEEKKARFDHNDQYDFSVFETQFDYFFSQSIWTHCGKKDIERMLDGFVKYGSKNARYLTTVKFPDLFHKDYKGDEWVGASHKSDVGGTVRHSFSWIKEACDKRNLKVTRLKGEKINTQHLILISKC
jgi:hypothetical protein